MTQFCQIEYVPSDSDVRRAAIVLEGKALIAEQRFVLTAVRCAAGIHSAVSAMTTTWRILA